MTSTTMFTLNQEPIQLCRDLANI